ncbi:DUF6809 family protein [uncultured Negativibacillus sp.]|uniref:DUF6809 family protein n=1 Tax=uncultured Negativibacillus sp. TaxID=1980696 RepID=UPI0025CC2997|nr:DUF6809 family protein [uncultured Negativibacillus sp.]
MTKRIWELLSVPPKITCPVQEEEERIRANMQLLKADLTPMQRKLLLRVVDDYTLIAEKTGVEAFEQGFRYAASLMVECFDREGREE